MRKYAANLRVANHTKCLQCLYQRFLYLKRLVWSGAPEESSLKRTLTPYRFTIPSQLAREFFARAFSGNKVLNPFIVGGIFRILVIRKVHRYISHHNDGKRKY